MRVARSDAARMVEAITEAQEANPRGVQDGPEFVMNPVMHFIAALPQGEVWLIRNKDERISCAL